MGDSDMAVDCAEIFGMPSSEIKPLLIRAEPLFNKTAKGLVSEEKFWEKLSEILGKPKPKDCAKKYREICQRNIKFSTEIFDLVKELNNRGIKTAVLSNLFKWQADITRKNKGYDNFSQLFLSCYEGYKKPEIEIYNLVLKKLGLKSEECIFVDDRERNILPAKSLGIKTILAKNPEQVIKDVLDIINL